MALEAGAKPIPLTEPAALMRSMLAAPRDSRLTGQEVGLEDVVVSVSSRTEQTALVDAYWDLCASVANYHSGLQEQAELRRLRSLVSRTGPAWQQAESAVAVEIAAAQRAAAACQRRLATMMGRGETDPLPLPGDMPHCGDYRARYEQIFTNRSSAEAAELNELLPLRHEGLRDAAGAVARAEEWLDTLAAGPNDNSDEGEVLRALELLALRRQTFVETARDYNRRIVRYTELAAPGQMAPDVLVGMLIKTDRRRVASGEPQRSTHEPGGPPRRVGSMPAVSSPPSGDANLTTHGGDWAPAGSAPNAGGRLTTAAEPAQASGAGQPRGGAAGQAARPEGALAGKPASTPSEAVRPTSADAVRREHSLLVPPRRR